MQICITCQSHRSTLFQTQPVGRCKWFPAEYDVQSQGALLVPESPRYNLFSQEMESPANPGRFILHDEISFGNIKPGTAKRRMSTVQNFYRWLKQDGKRFKYPLWQENDASLMFKDTRGFMRKKSFVSTDLTTSFKAVRRSNEFSEHINDSGKLRPLPKDEQQALVESLKRVANTEITLAFIFALTTGARLQISICNY